MVKLRNLPYKASCLKENMGYYGVECVRTKEVLRLGVDAFVIFLQNVYKLL